MSSSLTDEITIPADPEVQEVSDGICAYVQPDGSERMLIKFGLNPLTSSVIPVESGRVGPVLPASDLRLARGERIGRERALARDDHGPALLGQVAVGLPHGPA
jgi:hypothetical protein